MNTVQLECFLAVADNLSFARAAEQLHITQPAVTHQISSLENELNVKLFRRTTRTVALTNDGWTFCGYARTILKTTDQAKARLSGQYEDRIQSFSIGCHTPFELNILPPVLKSLCNEFPSIHPDLKIRNVVLAMGACTDSNYGAQYELPGTFAPIASFELLRKAVKVIEEMGNIGYKVGNVVSSDVFYSDRQTTAAWQKMGALAIEMESAALYMNAARAGKNALTICTISDSLVTGEVTTAEERQTSFDDMMKIALEIA